MRSSMRYDRRLMHAQKRPYASKGSRYARASSRCRVAAILGALLLLAGVLWLIRPRDAPISEGIDKSSLSRAESLTEDVWQIRESEDAKDVGRAGEEDGQHVDERMAQQQRTVDKSSPDEDTEDRVCQRAKYPAERELRMDRITILMNGFSETRVPLLLKHVQMYSSLAVVHAIYILWSNTSTPADFLDRRAFVSYGAPIYVVRQRSASLNDRFLPRPYIETGAVMICDDDITVDPPSLGFALDVWREDPSRIVGFFPRTHAFDPETRSWMYVKHYKSYSIMLTKLMILSTEYLFRYTCEMPRGVKEYVDAGMNCEDIAMNFLASNRSGRGPVLVEGKARDWGDPRNTAVQEFGESALSARKNHRKNRGDCISAFAELWRGMKLQLSYSKASPDLENRIQCEKFGLLMDCDASVGSRRDARRSLGEHLVSATARSFAYATFVPSDDHLDASLSLAQSIRSTGTIYDLVALVGASCGPVPESHFLHDHYDEVVRLNSSSGELSAWLLVDYVKVMFLSIDSLVLANLDHLFRLPELAAAPRSFMPGQFSAGLMVLTPSSNTHDRLLGSLEKMRPFHGNRSRQHLLNFVFDDWFQMPAENRLPARYNVPVVFSDRLQFPTWFHPDRMADFLGPLMVLRFGNLNLGPSEISGLPNFSLTCIAARVTLLRALKANNLLPLEDDNMTDWVPAGFSSGRAADSVWPPAGPRFSETLVAGMARSSARRQAIATVLYGSQREFVAGWAESFRHHHAFRSRASTLLLVLSTVDPRQYAGLGALFDRVRVVEPLRANGGRRLVHPSFALLHLWAQTDFDKLLYVAADSLFVDNCHSLLDYAPFAAIPSLFPPDTLSTRVMSVRPARRTFGQFVEKLSSPLSSEIGHRPVDGFLTAHCTDWYAKSGRHRIHPSYMVSATFESQQLRDDNAGDDAARPGKIMSFDLDWLPEDQRASATALWKKTLCGLGGGAAATKSDVVMSLCGAV